MCARTFVCRHCTFVRWVLFFRVWARILLEWARSNGGTEVLAGLVWYWRFGLACAVLAFRQRMKCVQIGIQV